MPKVTQQGMKMGRTFRVVQCSFTSPQLPPWTERCYLRSVLLVPLYHFPRIPPKMKDMQDFSESHISQSGGLR